MEELTAQIGGLIDKVMDNSAKQFELEERRIALDFEKEKNRKFNKIFTTLVVAITLVIMWGMLCFSPDPNQTTVTQTNNQNNNEVNLNE